MILYFPAEILERYPCQFHSKIDILYLKGKKMGGGQMEYSREEHKDCETLKKFKLMLLEFRSPCLTQFKSRITFKEYIFPLSYDTYFLLMYHIAATAEMNSLDIKNTSYSHLLLFYLRHQN